MACQDALELLLVWEGVVDFGDGVGVDLRNRDILFAAEVIVVNLD